LGIVTGRPKKGDPGIDRLWLWLAIAIDEMLKGFSLRIFSSATFGLLLGLLFANLLMASQILRYQSETTQWALRLVVYCAFGYLGMMLAMRSSRDEFSLIIPYVRFSRETTQREPWWSIQRDHRRPHRRSVRHWISQPVADRAAICSRRIANAGGFA
jgi:uncharacterized protein YacL